MKKFCFLLLCFVLVATTGLSNVYAYTFPQEFWSLNDKYTVALENEDYSGIVEYGNQIIALMENAQEGYERENILVTRSNEVGLAYVAMGHYEKSAEAFQKLLWYASDYPEEYDDYIKGAKARIEQYTPEISMYTDRGTPIYYGAVNEKKNGVLFGVCSNGETRSQLENESLVLTYQELGQKLLPYNSSVVKKAAASGCAVEFALNCPNEARDIQNIRKMDSYLKEISDLFSQNANVPIYLRFAAEFNTWNDYPEPDGFISAFQYVSRYFKERNKNVAMVWSPNVVSNWYVNMDDYYPGDAYVDWVGMSLYATPYFQGDKYQEEINEIVYKAGINSNPVIAAQTIVNTYGDRKPIMISESGFSHKLVKSGEDTTNFALQRLKEFYSYLPMVYPQIKVLAHFDWYVQGEEDDFRLSTNKTLQDEYLRQVKNVRFIQDSYDGESDYCNRPIYNGIQLGGVFELSCYAHKYNNNVKKVTYFIDDQYLDMATEVPYTIMANAKGYRGKHRLKAIAEFQNGETMVTESEVQINDWDEAVTVEISGKEVAFDQEPILYNDRTMVPMRKIFESLGATVSWDEETQTAIGQKGDRRVRVSVAQRKMYVNNKVVTLDTAPIVVSGRTLVPIRAVAEGLGCLVDWDGRNNLVSITPRVFQWSEWSEDLPSEIDEGLFYIEEREEYRTRTREKEYFTRDYKTYRYNLVDEKTTYGPWSDWQKSYISESETCDVETKTESSPKSYHYGHYCTGKISDKDNQYKTWDHHWHAECTYHDLGWFDTELPQAKDNAYSYIYYVDGKEYRCSNTCYRWYLLETTGGSYTLYRSRTISKEYTYWEWGDWSHWSDWDEDEPYGWYDDEIDIDERTVYRYKEKG